MHNQFVMCAYMQGESHNTSSQNETMSQPAMPDERDCHNLAKPK